MACGFVPSLRDGAEGPQEEVRRDRKADEGTALMICAAKVGRGYEGVISGD